MLFPALAASRGLVKKQMVKECLGMFDMITERNDDYKETLETTRLEMFANFAEKTGDFKKLYDPFGQFMKLGDYEDSMHRTKGAELMRWTSELPAVSQLYS